MHLIPRVLRRTGSLMLCLSLWASSLVSLHAASRQPVYSQKGLIASTSPLASETGAQILQQGGNAVDAAVAVALTLAVTWPAAGNLGGGGFALLRTAKGEAFFVDYREKAPLAAQANFYLDAAGKVIPEASSIGFRAVGVPGTPAGLELMHKRWGRLPWKTVVEPARRMASLGYRLEESHVRMLSSHRELLERFPETKKIFFPQGKIPEVGQLFVQKDLATSLQLLQKEGAANFYRGSVAKKIVASMKKNQGAIVAADLENYEALVREPLVGKFGPYEVISAPPPSSGGAVLLQMLGMLSGDKLEELGYGSAATLHLMIESMRRSFADRSEWFGDPGFVLNPLRQLLDPAYLAQRRASINSSKATRSEEIKPAAFSVEEKPETTHFTVLDREGMIVSNTYTLNGSFGSGTVAEGTGILLNNEMDDFSSKPGSPNMYGLIQNERNAIAPGKRPLSSMTPTIVTQNGKAILALGSPGGPTIINSVLQVTLNVLVHGMNIQEAVDAPRIHHQWMPDRVLWEPYGISPDTRRLLEGMGHILGDKPRTFGDVQAVYFDPKRQEWSGASDSRWGGSVVSPQDKKP